MAKRALRNGGVQFLTRARNGIASGFMYRPPWFDAAVQFQPLEVARSYGPVRPLEYPEDKLMARLEREHPELWENTIVDALPDDLGRVLYKHPASQFIDRQKHHISRGLSVDKAYNATMEDWRRQQRFDRIELQTAALQAVEMRDIDKADGPEVDLSEDQFAAWRSEFGRRWLKKWDQALNTRIRKDAQKRREKLESLMEAREIDRVPGPIAPLSLDDDITQEDIDSLVLSSPRAEEHFASSGHDMDIEIERMLPKKGDAMYEEFREYLDQHLPKEARAMLLSGDREMMPDENTAPFFKDLDGKEHLYMDLDARARRDAELEARRQAVELADAESAKAMEAGEEVVKKDKGPTKSAKGGSKGKKDDSKGKAKSKK